MYYKVKVQSKETSREVWLPIQAKSIGAAVVLADERCLETPFSVRDNSFEEISKEEYMSLVMHCRREIEAYAFLKSSRKNTG